MRSAFPFAALQAAVFLCLGLYLPFWPLWLAEKGLSAERIGLLLAVAAWIRIAATPAVGQAADRWRHGPLLLPLLALAATVGYGGFLMAEGFLVLLLLQALTFSAFTPLIPLADSRTLAAGRRFGFEYGRVRLWGSLAFILGSTGGGWLLAQAGIAVLPWLLIAALLLVTAVGLALPPPPQREQAPAGGFGRLLRNRSFLIVIATSALLQSSHALLYGFASLHWRNAGLGEAFIGWLWTLGVLAEIALFAAAPRLVARLGPRGLLLLGAAGGLIRWPLLAVTTDPVLLLPAQALHALTFAAAHLGAMHLIGRHAPPGLAATAQTINAALTGGLAMGGMLVLAGGLYETFGGSAFLAMTLLSLAGGALAFFGLRGRG